MPRRYFSYGGLGLILIGMVVFLVASKEASYETVGATVKGVVVSKEIRPVQRATKYGVTYRTTVQGRKIEREGDVGSQKRWDAIRVGDEIEVETIGVTAGETRLPEERSASSGVWRWIASAIGVAGVVLLGLRFRTGN